MAAAGSRQLNLRGLQPHMRQLADRNKQCSTTGSAATSSGNTQLTKDIRQHTKQHSTILPRSCHSCTHRTRAPVWRAARKSRR